MMRVLLRVIAPIALAVLLDRYCNLRAKQRHKKERAGDLTRWEGEGGAVNHAPRPAG